MNKLYTFLGAMLLAVSAFGQIDNPSWSETQANYTPSAIVLPQSPLSVQVLFVGGEDMVQTTETYGNAAGEAPAKQWHDFIGFTPATEEEGGLGWISINHEMIVQNDNIGDGGGMTVFKVDRDENGDLIILDQTLADGRSGQFFNVDFANTVGETGMNCGGITSVNDGRIWTAEEWFRTSYGSIADRNRSRFVVGEGTIANDSVAAYPVSNGFPGVDGDTLEKWENYNYMVEIDPREAVAIRKQYNWGKQGFEGGTVMPDNRTVYLGVDATPAYWCKFVAENAGDFTTGTLYAYKQDAPAGQRWIAMDVTNKGYLTIQAQATNAGCTMFNRIEWVAQDTTTGYVYWTETGRDRPGSRWRDESAAGAVHSTYTMARAMAQGTHPDSSDYVDYYGRIVKFDPATDESTVLIEGGPDFAADSVSLADYAAAGVTKHLSNPDGLNVMMIGEQSYLVINEDLNGVSYGRMPESLTDNRTCEMFLLDLSIAEPTVDDLIRITAVPFGAEITGACPTPDGKTLLVNSQHPNPDEAINIFPYNNSLTVAINGFDQLAATNTTSIRSFFENDDNMFKVFPNPVARTLHFEEATDAAILNLQGQQVRVVRDRASVDVSDLAAGVYTVVDLRNNVSRKLIIE